MYQHSTPLKYVKYGIIEPYCDEDNWLLSAYKWLGFHCGYCPHVWLARGNSAITGFRSRTLLKKRKMVIQKRKETKIHADSILFEFSVLPKKDVFPVDYDIWSFILTTISNTKSKSTKEEFDNELRKILNQFLKYEIEDKEQNEDYVSDCSYIWDWANFNGNVDAYMKKYLFVEHDQIVVPSLNLKMAKQIICRNEKQKKELRRMGFIEDRIKIKNIKKWKY